MKKIYYYFLSLIGILVMQVGMAQQKTITGTVVDDSGTPLPDASVIIKGTENGTTTDFDGNFSIQASEGERITVSFIGYYEYNFTVDSSDSYAISLLPSNALGEVVLTAIGTEKRKEDDITSTSVVEVEQLQRSGEGGVLQGLSGKTSGLNITRSSGDPGSGAYIQIRGQNTINGDISPLIVVDGAIISNSTNGNSTAGVVQQSRLNDINPDDIESVSVIKGASAAAIYGTGAANGVIVIKTKSGKRISKGWEVNVKSSYSFDTINIAWTKQDVFGQGTSGNFVENTGFSYGDIIADRSGGNDVYDFSGGYFETPSGTRIGNIDEKNDRNVYNQSNFDQVFGTGTIADNSINFSYSGEKSNTYVSIANFDQQGIIRGNSDYRRTSIKLNNTTDLTDNLKVKLNTLYSKIDSNRIQTGSNLSGLYLGFLRTSPDFDITEYRGTNYRIVDGITTVTPNSHRGYRLNTGSYRVFDNETGTFSYRTPTYNNPLWTINEQLNLSDVTRFYVAPEINYSVTDNIGLTARYTVDFSQDKRDTYFPPGSSPGSGANNGLYTQDNISERIDQLNVFANGHFDLSSDVVFDALVGYQSVQNLYNRISGTETNFTNPDQVFLNFGNATSENSSPDSFYTLTRKSGAYGIFNFELYENLLIELTGRAESLSTVQAEGLVFYPSFSAGYKLTDLIGSDAVNFLKVRGSWGQVGVEPSAYLTTTVFGTGGVFSSWGDGLGANLYGNPFALSSNRGNPDLTVERKTEVEFGFDAKLFNNKLSLNATYYSNATNDVILNLPTVPSSGFLTQSVNAATITNKGFEADFNLILLSQGDFKGSLFGTFTRNRNIVTELAGSSYFALNGFTSTSSGIAEGEAYGVLRGGVYQRDAAGDFILGTNGFPLAQSEKQVGVGDPNPDFRASLGLNLEYKNFQFTAFLETSQGNDVWNGTRGVLNFFGIAEETAVQTTNNTGATIFNADGDPIANGETFRGYITNFGGGDVAVDSAWWTSNGGGFGDVSEIFIEDGSWVKLREVSLQYNFDQATLSKIGFINSLSLTVTGRNLVTWTNVVGFDPENNLTGSSRGRGLEYFSNPGTQSVLTTLRIGF